MAGIVRIGIAGWTFAPWRGVFYPKGLKREHELEHAASQFRAIEIAGTFYGAERPAAFAIWADQVPANFVFPVRAPRVITHVQRLREVETPLADFIASGILRLGIHLGPILWELPSNLRFDPVQLEAFLRVLPHDTASAAALARPRASTLVRETAWLDAEANRPLRHAMEVRHDSYRTRACIDMLRAHDVALVCADGAQGPQLMDVTGDFVYCRLRGPHDVTDPAADAGHATGGYETAELDRWVSRIRAWAGGEESPDGERAGPPSRRRRRDVFVVFDNGQRLAAPANAMELIRRLRA